jgi:hypothetical protein
MTLLYLQPPSRMELQTWKNLCVFSLGEAFHALSMMKEQAPTPIPMRNKLLIGYVSFKGKNRY